MPDRDGQLHPARVTWLRTLAAKVARRRGSRTSHCRAGVPQRCHPAPNADRGNLLPGRRPDSKSDMGTMCSDRYLPDGRPSRPPTDAAPMMPRSGKLPTTTSTPARWAHRNFTNQASCWQPPRRPRNEACTRASQSKRRLREVPAMISRNQLLH